MDHDTLLSKSLVGLARPSSPTIVQATELRQKLQHTATSPRGLTNPVSDNVPNEANVLPLNESYTNDGNNETTTTPSEAGTMVDGNADAVLTSASLLSSESSPPGSSTPEEAMLQSLQGATEDLESIKEETRTLELSAVARARKSAAIRSPIPSSSRARSAAVTPIPYLFSPNIRNESLNVTAASSRAASPTRTPSSRAKRRKKDRLAVPAPTSSSTLLSIDAIDRRRSARVAKASVNVTNDVTPSGPDLSQFGFSTFLRNLVMGARESERRTRSGVRTARPAPDRLPAKSKKTAAKTKPKDKTTDMADKIEKEAKEELFRQLCILSYQLQAELETLPYKTLHQLEADLYTPPPEDVPEAEIKRDSDLNVTRPTYEPQNDFYDDRVKLEQHSRYYLVGHDGQPHYQQRDYSPTSSPKFAHMNNIDSRPPDYPFYQPSQHDGLYYESIYAQQAVHAPPSPIERPSRSNIMSISALMDGPPKKRQRHRSPTPARTIWTDEDDDVSRILHGLASTSLPAIDTTELDRLTQIVQLAALDVTLPSRASTPGGKEFSNAPLSLNPLESLNVGQLFDAEEIKYLDEKATCAELYDSLPCLASFDEVVDERRATELSRLRLELQHRRAEIERIWECDRKLAWFTYLDDHAGGLYRKQAMQAHHQKWQAQMELDLHTVHRRKTRGLAKLTERIWLPNAPHDVEHLKEELYAKYGSFIHGAKYSGLEDPLVRGDLDKLRLAQASQKRRATPQGGSSASPALEAEHSFAGTVEADSLVSDVAASASEYDSDSSTSSAISSLPSFSSLAASPGPQEAESDQTDTDPTSGEADSEIERDGQEIRPTSTPVINSDSGDDATLDQPAEARLHKQSTKRKRPPPPGARLWKQGQVQQETAAGVIDTNRPLQQDVGHAQPLYQEMEPSRPMPHYDPTMHDFQMQNSHHTERFMYEQQMYAPYEPHVQDRYLYSHPMHAPYHEPHHFAPTHPADVLMQNYIPAYHPQQHYPQHSIHTQHQPSGPHPHWPY